MKKILLPLVFLFIVPQMLFSQNASIDLLKNAKEVRMQDHIGTPSFISFRNDDNITSEQALAYSKELCSANNINFVLKNQQQSKDGKIVYKYTQTIDGYPVEFTSWHIHEKDGKVTVMNGDIVDIQDFIPVFLLSEEDALQAALNYTKAELYMWMDENEEQNIKIMLEDNDATYYPAGIKVIAPVQPDIRTNKLRTAYKFNIYSKKPFNRKMVYVDAQTGEILFDLPLIHFSDETGTAHTQYSGIQEINTELSGTTYRLRDNTRGSGIYTFNCQNTANWPNTDFIDDDNVWNNVNPQLDQYATDAHFATMSTYDYFFNIHKRNSIDGNGYRLRSYIHFNLIAYGYGDNVNAFWDGEKMTYGDGMASQGITPLTTIDICGHEITHGLTTYTANLTYAYESGALNEAFSDIFSTAIEFYAVPEIANWIMGDQIGITIRSMENPKAFYQPDTYQGQYWHTGSGDNGGVHTNSGVLNYWFYLLSVGKTGVNDKGYAYSVAPIGIEKAEQVAFKMLTEYLTPGSQHIDAYYAAISAAGELFGGCSPEVQAVGDAFYAVGVINQPYVMSTTADFKASESIHCTVPAQITFNNNSLNGTSYLWDFGDGTTSTESNPVHTYTQIGNYTVTLTVDGGECGNDVIVKENYIKIDPSMQCDIIMPSNGTMNIEGCAGVFYDAGGPNEKYPNNINSRLTIHAPEATSIVLTIEDFDIESGFGSVCNYDYIAFYNGNSTNAPLINNTRYCNTTGNPETITATGEYITIQFVSDNYVNYSGYKIVFQCVGAPTLPVAGFTASIETTCTGLVAFTDHSLYEPEEWLWNFGDGTTSNEQNPVHEYTQNGIYTVSLTVSNQHGEHTIEKTNLITVEIPETPEIEEIKGCINYEFEIALELEGTAHWYETIESEEPVFIGNIWNHPPIAEKTIYFLREVFETPEGLCMSDFAEVTLIPEICVSIGQYHLENLIILPNPSNGLFHIKGLTEANDYRYVVSDITGKIIVEKQPLASEFIDLQKFSNGIYFVTISASDSIKTYKLVLAK